MALVAATARAAETDPYYAWSTPPRDGTAALNRGVQEHLARGLREANASPTRASASCRDVVGTMVAPLASTAYFFSFSGLQTWGFDRVPRSASEYFEEFRPNSTYRYLGGFPPPDPALSAGGVLFGTDKLAHFFTNGLRYYDRWARGRAEGMDDEAAERAAIAIGVEEERTWLGYWASGIFSFADLEANYQGLQFYKSLCAGSAPTLQRRGDRWVMTKPFDIRAYVSPCWDEGENTSAFSTVVEDGALRGIAAMCPRLRRPAVSLRRADYREHACKSLSSRVLQEMVAKGEAPDPARFRAETVCQKPATPGQPTQVTPAQPSAAQLAPQLTPSTAPPSG